MKFKEYIKREEFQKEISPIEEFFLIRSIFAIIEAAQEEIADEEIREEFYKFTEKVNKLILEKEIKND